MIRIIPGKPTPTWTMNVILLRKDGKIFIPTIFPGLSAPPLPDEVAQSPNEYSTNKSFWDKHVFVVEQ
ncbi:MAG: hypothetical protein HY738_03630 [Bacteroidia bacterium]|nr:hypothetical protein [Bacteroidia bacterium]